jgi:hypothetical protein
MTIKCELTMLTFTKTKNTRLPDSVHNTGVTLQSRDIPHTVGTFAHILLTTPMVQIAHIWH